jgi:NAD(P)-dependent dehydrogenase (short-subunit alcohol dehydrogenase family)
MIKNIGMLRKAAVNRDVNATSRRPSLDEFVTAATGGQHGAMPTVLITGAARGIGRATTARLAAAGWTVYAGVRSSSDADGLIADHGPSVRPVHLDITSASDIAALQQHVGTSLDAVVNNAGIVVQGPVETLTVEDLRRQFDVNVVAQIAVTQALLPLLRANHGRVVFISSVSGRISTPLTGAYNASKFAIEAIADSLRVELRPWRIPVVLVQPASTATDMWSTALDQHEAVVAGLSPEHAELYGRPLARSVRAVEMIQKHVVPVDRVARTVEMALTARRPKARYLVDPAGRAQVVGKALTPTRVMDAVLARATGFSARP